MAKKKKKSADRADRLKEMKALPRRFEEVEKTDAEGRGIFYFHQPGDFVYGFLRRKQVVQTVHYPFRTYLIKALAARQDGIGIEIGDNGEMIEIPANIIARRIIDDNELIGSLVKIIFQGKVGQKKYYKVYKNIGTFHKNESEQPAKIHKKRKRRKSHDRKNKGDMPELRRRGRPRGQ